MEEKYLMLGSGTHNWPGWVTVDANPNSGATFIATMPPLPAPVLACYWQRIEANHFIEHLFKWDALILLQQCYQILEPGGVLSLEQPDIEYCAKVMLGAIPTPEGRNWEQFSLWGLYGAPNGNPLDGHHWGYSPKTLTDMVIAAGFSGDKIVIKPGRYHEPVRDFTLEAYK